MSLFGLDCYVCLTSQHPGCPHNDSYLVRDCSHEKAKSFFSRLSTIEESDLNSQVDDDIVVPSAIETDEMMVPVCRKTSFYVRTSFLTKSKDIAIEKRMIHPRIHFTCGVAIKSKSDVCTTRNSPDIRSSQCSCVKDLCNGSARSFSFLDYLKHTHFLMEIIILSVGYIVN
ncbi:uncharacterized protein LOC110857746 isoform X2 [Folsomia candida]|uniref:uncharacterized protein LOC110857746 isoform X2 n=1 Tax=Folsomia candida TaxID=158441 RepID=UPI001604B394|nr:uncharacterized protein LOC110857746 isoform X2 [Folsomia candida]